MRLSSLGEFPAEDLGLTLSEEGGELMEEILSPRPTHPPLHPPHSYIRIRNPYGEFRRRGLGKGLTLEEDSPAGGGPSRGRYGGGGGNGSVRATPETRSGTEYGTVYGTVYLDEPEAYSSSWSERETAV